MERVNIGSVDFKSIIFYFVIFEVLLEVSVNSKCFLKINYFFIIFLQFFKNSQIDFVDYVMCIVL